jgi:ATP-binding cassette subfamily B protein
VIEKCFFTVNINKTIRFISVNLHSNYENIITLPQTTQMADYCLVGFSAINQVFSLFAPAITGNILDQLVTHPHFLIKKN